MIAAPDGEKESLTDMLKKIIKENSRLLMYVGMWAVCVGCTLLICICTMV